MVVSKDRTTTTPVTAPAVMPDGTPAPSVMTEEELTKFLRIEDEKNATRTLRHYRTEGKLDCMQIGRRRLYFIEAVIRFLDGQSGRRRRSR